METRQRFRADPLNWLALFVVILGFVLIGAFFVLRANTPSDGTRMVITDPVWQDDGVVVTRWERNPDGLNERFEIVRVEGVPIADLAQAAVTGQPLPGLADLQRNYRFDTNVDSDTGENDVDVVYEARRALRDDSIQELRQRQLIPLPTRLGAFPWGAWAQQNWLVIASSIGCLAIAAFVFYKRPSDRTTRAMILWVPGLWASQVMYSLGLQVGDFIYPLNLWLFMITASLGYILTLVGIVRFAFEFTRPPDRMVPVLRNSRSIVATFLIPYAFFVLFLAWQWVIDPHALRWFSKWRSATAIIAVACIGLALLVSGYSYWKSKDFATRQKVRWIVYTGGLVGAISIAVVSAPALLIRRPLTDLALPSVLFLVFELAIAYAVFRYGYLELDVIVNRTLVVGVISAVLALLYFGALIVVQLLFGDTMSNSLSDTASNATSDTMLSLQGRSDVVIVLTTVIGIALFNPIRRTSQYLVDRVFYRSKYEASKRIARFTSALRDDAYADMGTLTADLLEVTHSVARPDGIGLWLREPSAPGEWRP
jgi:hypothetical protein